MKERIYPNVEASYPSQLKMVVGKKRV